MGRQGQGDAAGHEGEDGEQAVERGFPQVDALDGGTVAGREQGARQCHSAPADRSAGFGQDDILPTPAAGAAAEVFQRPPVDEERQRHLHRDVVAGADKHR